MKVGGELPTGFRTGNIRMTNISDATGYLINNTNSDHKYAPKQLHLFMDVAMIIDAVSEIDLKILGVDNAHAQISFHMEAYTAAETPTPAADVMSPVFQSAYPHTNTQHFSLGDNVTITYNEPLEFRH
ncbi:hypothetical protein [Moritella yayanosii]|uniref:Uncharacterized protein n=1 Tax=Moritella yayanosii TaxID=69539 RepID=A0A330LUH3_9GAMM|nr:hypothetical protein [Moritella yayanosii]SQD80393.1 protein of unknown function [Moritella yayanosii]